MQASAVQQQPECCDAFNVTLRAPQLLNRLQSQRDVDYMLCGKANGMHLSTPARVCVNTCLWALLAQWSFGAIVLLSRMQASKCGM
jgi:hypothetical protein